MITVYGSPGSRSVRVVWTLEELGRPYDYVPVDLLRRRVGDRRLTELNPACKVPILEDGDVVLTESVAICLYLAEQDPQRRLLPEDEPRPRARLLQWCSFAISELEQPLWTKAKHEFVLPKRLRVPSLQETAHHEFNEVVKILELGLGDGLWILGDRFTVADILIANTLSWADRVEWSIESATLKAYLGRALQRPAFARMQAREQAA